MSFSVLLQSLPPTLLVVRHVAPSLCFVKFVVCHVIVVDQSWFVQKMVNFNPGYAKIQGAFF